LETPYRNVRRLEDIFERSIIWDIGVLVDENHHPVNLHRGNQTFVILPYSALLRTCAIGSHVVPVDPMCVCKILLLGMFRRFQELCRL